jgi:hypothetical protein
MSEATSESGPGEPGDDSAEESAASAGAASAGVGAAGVGALATDMAAMLAQLRETIGNLDAVIAAAHEQPPETESARQ